MATEIVTVETPVIRAAGGIIQRATPHGDEVLIVFRKRHQDWALPKGEVQDGESFQEAALREVEQETGCTCELGNYLGTISYADHGTPTVVMFWKMNVVRESAASETQQIDQAVWIDVPSAIQKLSQTQEKALLSRMANSGRAATTAPQPVPVSTSNPQRKKGSIEDERVHARVLRESEAFRVELAFLERRSGQTDRSWSAAAHDQLDNVAKCLDSNDIEGALFCLHAARRFAVYGLNKAELMTRAHILREETQKIISWRGDAIDALLAGNDEELSADQLADAMKLRDEESTNQYYRNRLAGDYLRILLTICALAVLAAVPFMLLSGALRMLGPVLLFGLLGSAFSASQLLMKGKTDSIIPNVFVMVTPVLFGAVAGLAGFGIHEYLTGLFNFTRPHWGALLGMAFLFGMLCQRLLARMAVPNRRRKAH
ncbi:MAG TPA: NUDIX domain-containing protein [Candidatus Acidoferrales bacterium]|jgi:8-oxo-dGTP diphosphatase|nr:NUDIX domain-containing protein [Candidatus Acidoferrales bacterium]